MAQSRAFCFTWNNPPEEPVFPESRYLVYGKEIAPTTGTPHLQGLILFPSARRLSTVIKALPGCHVEIAHDLKASIVYCKKGNDFVEVGTPPSQGARNDFSDAREILAGKRSYAQAIADPALDSVRARYPKWVRETFDVIVNTPEPQSGIELRPWQSALLAKLSGPVDSREIIWVSDNGNTGKSFFATFLARNHGAFISSGGKLTDIAYAYDRQSIVIFDLSRTLEEFAPYQAMENFKDGRIFSSKYESLMKFFPIPHVVVFANFMPQVGKLSGDRLHYVETSDFTFP